MNIYQQAGGSWAVQAEDGSITSYATEQEARQSTMATAIQEYERLYREARASSQALLLQLQQLNDLVDANPQIAQAVEAAEPGAVVSGGTLPREAYQTAFVLTARLTAFVGETLVEGVTVKQAVLRLS